MQPESQEFLEYIYKHVDTDGRRYMLDNLNAPKPNPEGVYDYKEVKPPANGWKVSLEEMKRLDAEGKLHFAPISATFRLKRFMDERKSVTPGALT